MMIFILLVIPFNLKSLEKFHLHDLRYWQHIVLIQQLYIVLHIGVGVPYYCSSLHDFIVLLLG